MSAYQWVVHDATGADIRTTESFDSKEQAEAWMGSEWSTLVEAGGDAVTLMHGDHVEYRMGLGEG
jgi:hypothetical protein